MNITVLGCGALGQVWLAALLSQGHQVQGWLRVPQDTFVFNLVNLDGSKVQHRVQANSLPQLAQCDLLLVTLKAWQVSNAVKSLAPHLPPSCPILLIHNGMGTLEELRQLANPLLMGVTTHAARRDGNQVIHVASGTTHIGPGNKQGEAWSEMADVLQPVLPDVAWHDVIRAACWRKLTVNCVINPLTALYDCPNGGLKAFPEHINAICSEVALVMEREGFHISQENLVSYVNQVIDNTAENISSMLQDVRIQRHTEIDYITGYLLQRGRAHGISLPHNSHLYEQIKRKENNYERLGTDMPGSWN